MDRREFLKAMGGAAAAVGAAPLLGAGARAQAAPAATSAPSASAPWFSISLAGWSLHRRHFNEGKLPLADFPRVAREEFGIGAIELVNTMFPSPTWRAQQELLASAAKHDVKVLLIMCDAEGDLSAERDADRLQAVANHRKWLEIAGNLGCHSIRVNSGGRPANPGDQQRCIDSLKRLGEMAAERSLAVLCENHWGMSSYPDDLLAVMRGVGMSNVGTLPDFGNFPDDVDRYAAVAAMLPFAKAVSAKCHDFDAEGRETRTDFARMLGLVRAAGYRGWIGIEYEGERLSEAEGIRAAKRLLEKLSA